MLYQETKALITREKLFDYLVAKMKTLGTAACPPYHIAVVVGGTSADACLKAVKLASTGYYDHLPTSGDELGRAFRDPDIEALALRLARESEIAFPRGFACAPAGGKPAALGAVCGPRQVRVGNATYRARTSRHFN